MKNPNVLFEVSWEVCNMVGGIHTVIASKVPKMMENYGASYITIGPDILRLNTAQNVFNEEIWDSNLLQCLSALKQISIRMGYWMIPGKPKTLLINFGELLQNKNIILSEYWEKYQLHSLHGAWDYVEPLCFGQAAGMVIEAIYKNHFKPQEKTVIAQCHEWLAGSAILYLHKNTPEVGTVFTTHATALGRSLFAHHKNVDSTMKLSDNKLDQMAHDSGVSAKHSMEMVAAKICDCLTTVSDATAEECVQLLHRKPDFVLPNALGDEFQNPEFATPEKRQKTRSRLLELARLTTRTNYDHEKTKLIFSGGRYEFGNKGVDLFLESLALLNQNYKSAYKVLVFLMFPAGHTGPKRTLLSSLKTPEAQTQTLVCTHDLIDEHSDPIINKLKEKNLLNQPENSVHVIFTPIYLDGTDPLIPESYYEILASGDLSCFASYYEPWGYTPMESIAYGVPTITTDMAGFGRWALDQGGFEETGVLVLKRHGLSFTEGAHALTKELIQFLELSNDKYQTLKKSALKTSQQARWKNWGKAYFKAHAMALTKAIHRIEPQTNDLTTITPSREVSLTTQPVDISVNIKNLRKK
ncbi:MAG: glycosyltransferase [Deltaproteobacteria bacterium]|nr:glycosyltransferase [Deltaproteobacteria bacterium]